MAAALLMSVVLGTGSVIPGWDEGLAYFKKGGKGHCIFLSSRLMATGPVLVKSPTKASVFDVEIVDVASDAPRSRRSGTSTSAHRPQVSNK